MAPMGPWSSSKEPEKPMESPRGDVAVEESRELQYLQYNWKKVGSYGKMHFRSGLKRLLGKIAEQSHVWSGMVKLEIL